MMKVCICVAVWGNNLTDLFPGPPVWFLRVSANTEASRSVFKSLNQMQMQTKCGIIDSFDITLLY